MTGQMRTNVSLDAREFAAPALMQGGCSATYLPTNVLASWAEDWQEQPQPCRLGASTSATTLFFPGLPSLIRVPNTVYPTLLDAHVYERTFVSLSFPTRCIILCTPETHYFTAAPKVNASCIPSFIKRRCSSQSGETRRFIGSDCAILDG